MPSIKDLCGWRPDENRIADFNAQNPTLMMQASHLLTGERVDTHLWNALLTVKPSWKRGAQAIGDCQMGSAMVTMADGSLKRIDEVQVGEQVISGSGVARRVTALIHKPPSPREMVSVTTRSGVKPYTATIDHRVPVIGADGVETWKPIGEATLSDSLVVAKYVSGASDSLIDRITSNVTGIERFVYEGPVYCLEVEVDHTFIGDGYIQSNCVSWGSELACTVLMALQHVKGTSTFIAEAATEPIYGGCRVEALGKRSGGWSDGAFGAAAAKWVRDWGAVLRVDMGEITGISEHDLRVYSGKKAKDWGNYGCGGKQDGGKLDTQAKAMPVQHVVGVRTVEEAAAAIQNLYPLTIASMAGFGDMRRDANGIVRRRGQWAHQMCLVPGTLIFGKDFKNVEEVVVGDLVYGHDGALHKVTHTHKRAYKGKLITITSAKHAPLTVTEDHPVLVYRTITRAKLSVQLDDDPRRIEQSFTDKQGYRYVPIWVKAKDVLRGDYVAATKSTEEKTKGFRLELVKNDRATKPITSPELDAGLAYLFGFFVGDGDVKKNHGIRLTCGLNDDVDRLCDEIRKFGVEPRVKKKDKYTRIIADSVILAESFRQWFGDGAKNKHFPSWLVNSEFTESAIEGYVAADGCEYKNRKQCVTISWKLAQQVQFMLHGCGIASNLYAHDNSGSSFPNSSPTWIVVWQDSYTRICTKQIGNLFLHRVKTITDSEYEGDVYNLDVADVRSFVADGIIVHNCVLGIRWRAGSPEFRIFQSWGPRSCSGPDPGINHPAVSGCSWWCTADDMAWILRTGDCWIYGDLRGLPPQKLDLVRPASYWFQPDRKISYEMDL